MSYQDQKYFGWLGVVGQMFYTSPILPHVGDLAMYGKGLGVGDRVAEGAFLMANEHVEVVQDVSEMATHYVVELKVADQKIGMG